MQSLAVGRAQRKKTLCVSAPLRAKKNISKKKSSSSLLQLGGLSATADRQALRKEKRIAPRNAAGQAAKTLRRKEIKGLTQEDVKRQRKNPFAAWRLCAKKK